MAESAGKKTDSAVQELNGALADVDFRPLYKQVKDSIIQQLVAGGWRPGDKLPSEFELADKYRVSQGTIRKALDELTAQRLLVRQQGRGTFVSTHNPHRALFHFFHLIGRDGSRVLPTSHVIDRKTRRATKDEEDKLELKSGSKIICIGRVRDMGGRPAIVEKIIVSASRFSGLADIPQEELPNTLYELYEEEYGVTIYQAEEYLRAVGANAREAELLGLEVGHPLQEIDRLALGIDRRPVEWRVSRCLTDQHRYLSIID
jgi:GntR family transcriptional regulator